MPEPTHAKEPFLDLYRRKLEGDEKAEDSLFALVQPWLHAEIHRLMGNQLRTGQDSQDLAQNAVLNFLRFGPRFVPKSEAQLKQLLRRIATNEIIDEQRRQSRREKSGPLEPMRLSGASFSGFAPAQRSADGPSREAQRNEEGTWVRLALQLLEPDERDLLLMSEVEEQDWAAIAAELGLQSADTARMRCSRLKSKLALILLQIRRGQLPPET